MKGDGGGMVIERRWWGMVIEGRWEGGMVIERQWGRGGDGD